MIVGQSLLYDSKTGKIQEIDKTKFLSLLKKKMNITTPRPDLNQKTYKEIVTKDFEIAFDRLSQGIYKMSLQSSTNIKVICLLDKTFEDFQKYCKRNNWKVEENALQIQKISMRQKVNLVKKVAVASLVCFSSIALLGCGNAETMGAQKQETKIETTYPANQISETQKQVEKEIKKAETKQKIYTLADYKAYLEDEYTGNSRIEGDYVVSDIYDEYDDDGNFLPGVVSRTEKQSIEQLNQVLAWRDAGQSLVKTYKSRMAATGDDKSVIISYTLQNGQTVELPEGSRPEVPDGYVREYVVEMYVRGNSITSNSGGKTHLEQAQVNHAISQQIQAEIRARNQEENERRLAERDERVEQLTQELREKQAEGEAADEYARGARAIWEEAQHEYHNLMRAYADHYIDLNEYGKELSMKEKDPDFKKISHASSVEPLLWVAIKKSDWYDFCAETNALMDEYIAKLEDYDCGEKMYKSHMNQVPSLIRSLEGIKKENR